MGAFVIVLPRDPRTGLPEISWGSVSRHLPAQDDGHEVFHSKDVALQRARFRVVPEDSLDDPSVRPDDEGFLCVADARLDNRDELIEALDLGGQPQPMSDASLIRHACRRWGSAAPTRLLGDFAFVVWNRVTRWGLAATDPFGIRTVRYAIERDRLILSSRARPVALLSKIGVAPDAEFLRAYLAGDTGIWYEGTAYRGVRRLSSGTMLVIDGHQARVETYHSLSEHVARSATSRASQGEAMAVAIERAVDARLRSRSGVAVALSGGVDSSVVAGIAARLAPARGMRVTAISTAFWGLPECDERGFVEAVLRHQPGLRPVWTNGFGVPAFGHLTSANAFCGDEVEGDVDRSKLVQRAAVARDAGHRVILSGHWADQVFGGYTTPELLLGMPPWRQLKELPHFLRTSGSRGTVSRVLRAWRQSSGRQLPLPARLRAGLVTSGSATMFHQTFEQWHDDQGVEWRVPFLDLRVVALALSLSAEHLVRGGVAKRCLRSCFAADLPAAVAARRGGAGFAEVARRGMVAALPMLRDRLRDSPVIESGWTDRGRIERALVRYTARSSRSERAELVRWLTADDWIRRYGTV